MGAVLFDDGHVTEVADGQLAQRELVHVEFLFSLTIFMDEEIASKPCECDVAERQ
jgi:hypothetical protein